MEKDKKSRTYGNYLDFNTVCIPLLTEAHRENKELVDLSFSFIKFTLLEGHGRPDLRKWHTRHQKYLVEYIEHEKENLIVPRAATAISTRLTAWADLDFPSDYFKASEADRIWKKICDQLNIDLVDISDS